MSRIYARSRINLGFGGIGHSRNLVCLKGRDFEVPMSGALYVTQHNPELALVFDIGREIVTYRDESELRAAHSRAAGRSRARRTDQARGPRTLPARSHVLLSLDAT